MSDDDEFSVDAARAAADRDELGPWVARFLSSPGSDNAALAEQLSGELRWWIGPVQVPINRLHRLAGPPGAPVLEVVDDDYWRDDVEEMHEEIDDGWTPPPVIASLRDDQLVLEDGNHRVESLRRSGVREAWTIIGFASAEDRDRFTSSGGAPSI